MVSASDSSRSLESRSLISSLLLPSCCITTFKMAEQYSAQTRCVFCFVVLQFQLVSLGYVAQGRDWVQHQCPPTGP